MSGLDKLKQSIKVSQNGPIEVSKPKTKNHYKMTHQQIANNYKNTSAVNLTGSEPSGSDHESRSRLGSMNISEKSPSKFMKEEHDFPTYLAAGT